MSVTGAMETVCDKTLKFPYAAIDYGVLAEDLQSTALLNVKHHLCHDKTAIYCESRKILDICGVSLVHEADLGLLCDERYRGHGDCL
mmetsp:Transcript_28441/g.78362  ORF Transcript_28441/g.78362 Transcript_28441/m.78362 type:complete len:87 (+) Transcript_28441:100-360(+)